MEWIIIIESEGLVSLLSDSLLPAHVLILERQRFRCHCLYALTQVIKQFITLSQQMMMILWEI